ncbi:MAG: NAD(P)H-hydrate epimerase [Propionibacteriaceae bacterium]|nr:NAD(P)H-hydrate epimerase [Propionibacteriaceae bacterium]
MSTSPVTAAQMKDLDALTITTHGIPALVLMERAALACVDVLREEYFNLSRVIVVCGTGNNGGDGVAVARLLHLAGVKAEAVLVGDPSNQSKQMSRQLLIAYSYRVPLLNLDEARLQTPTTVVDAVLGIGGTRAPAGEILEAVRYINAKRKTGARVLALDIPTGVSTDTGEIPGEAVQADITVTFAYQKRGLTLSPGREAAGRVVVKDIGIYA